MFNNVGYFTNSPELFKDELKSLSDALLSRIENMTDADLKECRKDVHSYIIYYTKSIFDNKEFQAFNDKVVLTGILKGLSCGVFEKKLKAVADLNNILLNYSTTIGIKVDISLEHASKEEFIDWVVEQNILDKLLGKLLHEEILSRAMDIFEECAKKVGIDVLKKVWQLYEGDNSLYRNSAEEILKRMLRKTETSNRVAFFEAIVDKKRSDERYLNFVTEYTFLFAEDEEVLAIPFLWEKVFAKGNSAEEAEKYLEYLCKCFENQDINLDKIAEYVKKCLEMRNNTEFAAQALLVLKTIMTVTMYGQTVAEVESNLIDLSIQNLTDYLERHPSVKDVKEAAEGLFSHEDNIKVRMSITECASNKYIQILSADSLISLWKIGSSRHPEERQIVTASLVKWFKSCEDEEHAQLLFEKIFLDFTVCDYSNFTDKEYKLFEIAMEKALEASGVMWKMVVENRYNLLKFTKMNDLLTILSKIRDLISKTRLSNRIAEMLVDISSPEKAYDQYFSDVLAKIEELLVTAAEEKDQNTVEILIHLLKKCIEFTDREGKIPAQEDYIPTIGKGTIVVIHNHKAKNSYVNWEEELFYFRTKIAYLYDFPINALCFNVGKKVVTKYDDFSLCKDVLKGGAGKLVVNLTANPYSELSFNIKAKIFASPLVGKLRQIINTSEEEYCASIAQLLISMPLDEEMEDKLNQALLEPSSEPLISQFDKCNFYSTFVKLFCLTKITKDKSLPSIANLISHLIVKYSPKAVISKNLGFRFYLLIVKLVESAAFKEIEEEVRIFTELVSVLKHLFTDENVGSEQINSFITVLHNLVNEVKPYGVQIFEGNADIIDILLMSGTKGREKQQTSFIIKIVIPFLENAKLALMMMENLTEPSKFKVIIQNKQNYILKITLMLLRKYVQKGKIDFSEQIVTVSQSIKERLDKKEFDEFFDRSCDLLAEMLKSQDKPDVNFLVESGILNQLMEEKELRHIKSLFLSRI